MSHFVSQCGHCGRDGTLTYVKTVEIDSEVVEAGPHGPEMDQTYSTNIEVARCSQCGQPTLTRDEWMDLFDEPGDAFEVRQLYPVSRSTSDLPERVARRYGGMLAQLGTPDMFAVGAGRVLEAVCLDHGIGPKDDDGKRRDLYNRLLLLVTQGHLPRALRDQADLVREYRNLGGHDSDVEPGPEDVPLIRDFVESVLDFLFWGPAKLKRASADLKRRLT